MQDDQLVLQDDKGNFYVLSRATLEAARVDGARKAELERALTETDVSGYALLIPSPNSTFPTLSPSVGEFKVTGILRQRGGAVQD